MAAATVEITDESSERVAWRGTSVPRTVRAAVHDERFAVELEIVVDAGRPTCRVIRSNGPALTGAFLRQLPIGKLVTAIMREVALEAPGQPNPGVDVVLMSEGQPVARLEAKRAPERGRPISDSELEVVATIYMHATAVGAPPSRAVADELQVPYSTAKRWVSHARSRGLLPHAPHAHKEGS